MRESKSLLALNNVWSILNVNKRRKACRKGNKRMYSYPVEFTILTDNRNPLTEYKKNGKIYVEGRKNSNYVLQVTNKSMTRYEIVISVDGLDIIDGEPAISTKRGYILSPY